MVLWDLEHHGYIMHVPSPSVRSSPLSMFLSRARRSRERGDNAAIPLRLRLRRQLRCVAGQSNVAVEVDEDVRRRISLAGALLTAGIAPGSQTLSR